MIGIAAAPMVLPPAPLPVTRPLNCVALAMLAWALLRRVGQERAGRWQAAAGGLIAGGALVLDLAVGLPAPALYAAYLQQGSLAGGAGTSIPLVLVAIALLVRAPTDVRVARLAGFVAYVSLLTWLLDAEELNAVGGRSSPGWTSATTLALVAAVLLVLGEGQDSALLAADGLSRPARLGLGLAVFVVPPALLILADTGGARGWWSNAAADAVAAALVVALLYWFVQVGSRVLAMRRDVDAELLHRVASESALDEATAAARVRVLDALPTGIAELSASGEVLWANRSWWSITGVTSSSSTVDDALRLVHPDDREAVDTARADGGDYQVRARLVRDDGTVRHVEVIRRTELAVLGGAGGGVVLLRDRTEAAQAEEATAAANEAYRVVTEFASDAITRQSTHAGVTWASPAVREVFGVEPEEMLGNLPIDRIHPDDLAQRAQRVAQLDIDGGPVDLEFRWMMPDGTYRWKQSRITAVHGAPGSSTTRIAITRDVQDAVDARRTLVDSERRFRLTMESSPIATLLVGVDGRVLGVNEAATALLGRDDQELCSTTLADLTHPEDAAGGEDLWQRMVDGELDLGRVRRRFTVPDGALVWGDMSLTILRDDDGRMLHGIAQIVDITESLHALDLLTHRALHDSLTDLPNRDLVLDHLELSLARTDRTGTATAVAFIDLDHFKAINDALGHASGDEVLRIVAERMQTAVRSIDTVGRLGGDEFVIIFDDLPDTSTATDLAGRVREAVTQPVVVSGHTIVPSLSMGITTSTTGRRPASEMLRDADTALYRAKANGRARYELFDDSMRQLAVERLAREDDVRRAVAAEAGFRLEVHLQPLVDLRSSAVVGHEALARLVHPQLGLIPPGRFLHVAEEAGLMVGLGRRVADEVIDLLVSTALDPDTFVSLNVSPTQLASSDLAGHLSDRLDGSGVHPGRLTLEITEQTLLSAGGSSHQQLTRLAGSGVRLAIDDFGTGYAALAYLRDLPITYVKLDMSFVRGVVENESDRRMARAIADLLATLEMTGIAEGIETIEQARTVHELGWPLGQGYYFGRPAPVEAGAGTSAGSIPQQEAPPPR